MNQQQQQQKIEQPIKKVLTSIYLLKNIKKWITLIHKIESRDIIRYRIINDKTQSFSPVNLNPILPHPDLLIKTFNQASKVIWLLDNGYEQVILDKLRLNHSLLFEGIGWLDHIKPNSFSAVSFQTDKIRDLLNRSIRELGITEQEDFLDHISRIGKTRNKLLFNESITIFLETYRLEPFTNLYHFYKQFGPKLYTDIISKDVSFRGGDHQNLFERYMSNPQLSIGRFLLFEITNDAMIHFRQQDISHIQLFDVYQLLFQLNDYSLFQKVQSFDPQIGSVNPSSFGEYIAQTLDDIINVKEDNIKIIESVWTKFFLRTIPDSLLESAVKELQGFDDQERSKLSNVLKAIETCLLVVKFLPSISHVNNALTQLLKHYENPKVLEIIIQIIVPHIPIDDKIMYLFRAACSSGRLQHVEYVHAKMKGMESYQHLKIKQTNPPVTENIHIFKYLERYYHYTQEDLSAQLDLVIKDYTFATYIIHTHIQNLPTIPKMHIVDAITGGDVDVVVYLLETYYRTNYIFFLDEELLHLFKHSHSIYFLVKNFKTLKQWFNETTFGQYSRCLIHMAIYFDKLDIVKFLRPRDCSLEYCFASSPELITYCTKLLGEQGFYCEPNSWVNIGRIGNIRILELVITNNSNTTNNLNHVLRGAFEYGNLSIISHIEEKYHLIKYNATNLTRSLMYNATNIVEYYLTNRSSSVDPQLIDLLLTQERIDPKIVKLLKDHKNKMILLNPSKFK
ncbi:hypothetical protein DFA_02508 [Cavenderia fasciculata]|uniref:Ankyrin repeat-containing protein n=1 Tax=Cavenderia fasciculata TaxID=261658 RepID=F4PZK5_CACFS|nr:uncharacterized protein DFA_02508 [Cavenderia fasciculata]EGG18769.1 hypothetical protein DFA_02508 [Cavenderia fasciculata]|eukprot:XP_004357231.1 hypothetical protein DFA_02508 [Cavenderia fasciculata]